MVGRKWWAAENAPAEQGRGGRRRSWWLGSRRTMASRVVKLSEPKMNGRGAETDLKGSWDGLIF